MQYGLSSAGTLQVNSQLVPVPMSSAFYPSAASAPFYRGSGQPPLTIPMQGMQSAGDMAAQNAAANPWSFSASPLPIAVIALIVGLLGLRYIHWRG